LVQAEGWSELPGVALGGATAGGADRAKAVVAARAPFEEGTEGFVGAAAPVTPVGVSIRKPTRRLTANAAFGTPIRATRWVFVGF
jgi:hypothetical protein